MEKTKQTVPSVVPRHVAIIMDGNNRWAKKRFMPGVAGHKAVSYTHLTLPTICSV